MNILKKLRLQYTISQELKPLFDTCLTKSLSKEDATEVVSLLVSIDKKRFLSLITKRSRKMKRLTKKNRYFFIAVLGFLLQNKTNCEKIQSLCNTIHSPIIMSDTIGFFSDNISKIPKNFKWANTLLDITAFYYDENLGKTVDENKTLWLKQLTAYGKSVYEKKNTLNPNFFLDISKCLNWDPPYKDIVEIIGADKIFILLKRKNFRKRYREVYDLFITELTRVWWDARKKNHVAFDYMSFLNDVMYTAYPFL